MMTVDEMIERLQEIAEAGGGERELRLATQPNYPLAHTVAGVIDGDDAIIAAVELFRQLERTRPDEERDVLLDEAADEHDVDSDDLVAALDARPEGPIWILEGGHPGNDSPYASKRLWDNA